MNVVLNKQVLNIPTDQMDKEKKEEERRARRNAYIIDLMIRAPCTYNPIITKDQKTREAEIAYLTSMSRKAKTQYAKVYKFNIVTRKVQMASFYNE
jgi:hypothetical protein